MCIPLWMTGPGRKAFIFKGCPLFILHIFIIGISKGGELFPLYSTIFFSSLISNNILASTVTLLCLFYHIIRCLPLRVIAQPSEIVPSQSTNSRLYKTNASTIRNHPMISPAIFQFPNICAQNHDDCNCTLNFHKINCHTVFSHGHQTLEY